RTFPAAVSTQDDQASRLVHAPRLLAGRLCTVYRTWPGEPPATSSRSALLGRHGALVVLRRDVLAGVVGHQRGRDEADHRAGRDVDRDRVARLVVLVQPGGDQRRRSASDDRGELIAERGAAVAQAWRERLGDERGLRAVLHVVRDERENDRDDHQYRDRGVDHAEIDEPEHADRGGPDQVHLAAAYTVRDVARERDRDERHAGRDEHRREDEVARHLQG